MLDELQRRNYSPATTRGYIHAIKQFAEYFHKSPERLGGDEIRQFELYLLKEKKLAPGTVEGRMSALRFLFKKVLKRRDIAYDDLIFPKIPRKLPVVLSPEEVTRMIEAAPNLLHRTILMVLYATGIRRTEASLPRGRSLRLRASEEFPEAPSQGGVAGCHQFLERDCVREVGSATAPRCASGATSVS
jgi:site-specific recombinase XerD